MMFKIFWKMLLQYTVLKLKISGTFHIVWNPTVTISTGIYRAVMFSADL